MKRKIAWRLFSFLIGGFLFAASGASAQTVAYRQSNLSSDVNAPGFANNIDQVLQNPWGIAFQPRGSFFIADAASGHVSVHDGNGAGTQPGGFIVPTPGAGRPETPTGIVADASSFLEGSEVFEPFITATEDGGIFVWGKDANGDFPPNATLAVDHSQSGAVYTGIAILTPDCCAPLLAVANFHSGLVETYSSKFILQGSFNDPALPAGFAPFGMQVIGNQLFVAYALQDAPKHDPVAGAGNGIVSVFDFQGHFIRRFATAGPLNAPWGIAQASANFGPFSNDILIGNAGDGTISAFDLATGNFAGQIKDGDGNVIVNAGLHALAFRSDEFADPDTLFFSAGINNGLDGLFGAITTGLVSTTRVSVPSAPANTPVPFTVTVSAGPGNPGTPTGLIDVQDGGVSIAHVSLTNGMSLFPEILTGVRTHVIEAKYSGDTKFLPSTSQTEVQVTGPATTLNLLAPAIATSGSPVTLTATIRSEGGSPTGQIVFLDGNTDLGTAPLSAGGAATLTVNTLAAGAHSLTASFAGDGNFGGSTSSPVNTTVITRDFSLGAAPTIATVTAGQSALFNLTVTPAGGFADPVTFSCPVLTGITCSFNPPAVTPNTGAVTTMLTVTTSAGVTHYGQAPGTTGSGFFLATLGLFGALALFTRKTRGIQIPFLKVAASALSVLALAVTLVSCGGYTTSGQTNRGTASILVTAQSRNASHTTNISVTVQ